MPLLSRMVQFLRMSRQGRRAERLSSSVFGFDRIRPTTPSQGSTRPANLVSAPAQSLVLKKASGQTAHGGACVCRPARAIYETVRGWIAAGVRFGSSADPTVTASASIHMNASCRFMAGSSAVVARYVMGENRRHAWLALVEHDAWPRWIPPAW